MIIAEPYRERHGNKKAGIFALFDDLVKYRRDAEAPIGFESQAADKSKATLKAEHRAWVKQYGADFSTIFFGADRGRHFKAYPEVIAFQQVHPKWKADHIDVSKIAAQVAAG